jgi:hypothetical protein
LIYRAIYKGLLCIYRGYKKKIDNLILIKIDIIKKN